MNMRVAGVLLLAALSGCGLFPQSESCAPDASCIPSISWDDATYYSVGSRGAVIAASNTHVIGELTSAGPGEAADSTVLALEGVDPSSAVAMRAAPGFEVAPGMTVDYLIYIREAVFPATLCRYYVANPPGDPAPPPLPDICQ